MSVGALTPDELEHLYGCIRYGRMGNGMLFACAALFLFDFCLTFYDELRFIWKPRRITLTSVSYLLSRYPVLATTILILLPSYTIQEGNETLLLSQIAIVLRLASIVSSEFILAVRTWAIWEKSRRILMILTVFSVAAVVPAAVVIAKDVSTSEVDPVYAAYPECRALISTVRDAYVVPYVLTILYEGVTLSLSLIRITRWRRRIPKNVRAPLLDTLWRDGVFYFSWTLMLGFLNIGLAVQSTSSQVRVGGSQLQAIIHSILSCRIVLHLAGSKSPKDIDTSGCSLYTDAAIQFTTRGLIEDIPLSEPSHREARDVDSRDVEAATPAPRMG
ncbi:uncharacterized protein EV420DRAFT_1162442 [Desarmillaria tabescens]|uniref:DUF6533 domain-containing protein n=1 Tax=Armillaria tabescens TaxID=1929756 RepID=A0AA39NCR4_ARMTA|nr:uncharacterized protein EV420DRAFT_1162442 [Desarmillaria tabescens]KAK0463232.1 hypothetical protein EV420DRAFT_1162442 [Desarmillaria tabescens]